MIEPSKIQADAEELMQSAILFLDDALAHIRAGKASARILDPVRVDYYGSMSPLANVATITTPDARTIQIQPWEKKMLGEIERAIINSNIGLAPNNNGECIRLILPPLTEERRQQLAKQCKGEARMPKYRCAMHDAMLSKPSKSKSKRDCPKTLRKTQRRKCKNCTTNIFVRLMISTPRKKKTL